MSQADSAGVSPADLIALAVADDGVRVWRSDDGGEAVPWDRLPAVLTAHSAATFVVEDAAAVFGRLVAEREDSRLAWAVLDRCRVLDLGLANETLRLRAEIENRRLCRVPCLRL